MEDNIILMPVECKKCNTEFWIIARSQEVTCPTCGVTDKCEVVWEDK